MAETIKYKAANSRFSCGSDFTNLRVINFTGPGGARACAYSCNMNIDLDGEPQGYAPLSKPHLRPMDNLGDGGWKSTGDNAAIKKRYDAGKIALADLEKKKADLIAKAKPPATLVTPPDPSKPAMPPAKPTPDPAVVAVDKEITAKKLELRAMSFEHTNANGDYAPGTPNPKNFETIFWKWYGVVSMTPAQAQSATYLEMTAKTLTIRKPVLDKSSFYEDVFGRFPVVQSEFEPGPGYFVGRLPPPVNPKYPPWDQRYFMRDDPFAQEPFAALSTGLRNVAGVALLDNVFSIRLDTGDTLTFPFRDSGNGNKVAECSFAAFTSMGGVYHPENEGAAKFPNDFQLVYLAFPGGQSPSSVLARFATASNATDFPAILAFIAKATADAKAKGSSSVNGDPIAEFEKWKKSGSAVKPAFLDVINQALAGAGSTFVQNMMRKHASLLSNGPLLKPPTMP